MCVGVRAARELSTRRWAWGECEATTHREVEEAWGGSGGGNVDQSQAGQRRSRVVHVLHRGLAPSFPHPYLNKHVMGSQGLIGPSLGRRGRLVVGWEGGTKRGSGELIILRQKVLQQNQLPQKASYHT